MDDVRTDPLGNLIATINPGKAFTLLLDAHMDDNVMKGKITKRVIELIKKYQFREIVFVIGWVKSNKTIAVRGCKTANEKIREDPLPECQGFLASGTDRMYDLFAGWAHKFLLLQVAFPCS